NSTSLEVTREQLQVDPVDAKVASRGSGDVRIAYLRIRQFSDEVPATAATALAGMFSRAGARGIVLDLRGNGGGSLRAVATVAGFFVDSGKPIGIEVDRARRRTPLNAEGTPIRPLPPIAVLVDNGTASGAEILVSALKEYGLATVVGTQTSGSVAVSDVQHLSDGSQVQITVHRFVSPSGGELNRIGVQPDEQVELKDSDLAA